MASAQTKKTSGFKRFFHSLPMRIIGKLISTLFKLAFTVLVIGVITATVVAVVMSVYVITNFNGNEGLPDIKDISVNETSIIFTKGENGQWQEHQRLEGTDFIWSDLEDIPLDLQHAVVAIEDKRFYEHDGVDWRRTLAASANLVLHFRSNEFGGSTLTQQLIKLTTGDSEQTIERKITEIMRAINLEKSLDGSKVDVKEQILEAYLNLLPLSNNVVGVGAAANNFFGKDVSELSLAECAAIAGITQNPSRFSPTAHPENLRLRQRVVLGEMLYQGYITEDEYLQAVNEELHVKGMGTKVAIQDYYTDLLIEEVAEDLMDRYGYPYSQAISKIYRGGLRIYSNENLELQRKAEAVYLNEDNFPAKIESDEEDPQGAIFVIDYEGHVVATVGGRGKKTVNRGWSRSTDSRRQCGSSIKPLTSYGPAVTMNLIHFSSKVPNAPITLANGSKWPRNYGQSLGNRGTVFVYDALQRSLNTAAAQIIQMVTLDKSYSFITSRLNFDLPPEEKDYAQLTLGGFTYGVTCREMAEGYQIFGNGGRYSETSTYSRVEQDGEIILQPKYTPVQVIDEDSAYVMNRLLQRVIRSGTATAISGSWGDGWEVFAKTGTSGLAAGGTDKDVYFAGGTTQYAAASWFGYDTKTYLRSGQTKHAMQLWNKVMLALRDNSLPVADRSFNRKGTTVEAEFCLETGLLVGEGNSCPKTMTGVYKANNLPGYCDVHIKSNSTTPGGGTDQTDPEGPEVTIDLTPIYGN